MTPNVASAFVAFATHPRTPDARNTSPQHIPRASTGVRRRIEPCEPDSQAMENRYHTLAVVGDMWVDLTDEKRRKEGDTHADRWG
jgi:hypothetical protein